MTSWVINIVGMVFIGVILEVILPSGKTNSFIKSVFAIFLLYIIVLPLPKLFNKGIHLNNTSATVIDLNYLININLTKVNKLEDDIVKELDKNGYKNVSVVINANIYGEVLIINKVYIDLYNMVLKDKDKHININNNIKNIVKTITDVKEGDIVIYER